MHHVCNKNQQNAHFLHYCFNLITVSSTGFEHPECSSSERLVHTIVCYLFHASI